MGAVADIVEDVFDAATEVVETLGRVVVNTVDFVVEKIVEPVAKTVSGVIDAALDDPIKTIAQIAAVATGNAWALPLIEGADVAIAGGDIGDVLEATAKAYVVQQVGSYVGQAAGSFVGEAATEAGAELGTKKIITDAVTSGVRSATVAVVTGQDPLKALVTSGVTAGTAAALGQVDGFKEFAKTNPAAAGAISSGIGAALSGGNVGNAAIMGLISGASIVKDIIKQVDPDNGTAKAKLDPTQTAIVTDVLMNTASVAINGGQPSSVVKAALLKAGSKALGEMLTGNFKDTATGTTTKYADVVKKSAALEKNISDQEAVADDYNNLKAQIDIRITEQSRLAGLANTAINTYNNDKTQANYDAAMAAKNTADAYTTSLNKDYAEFYRPKFDEYSTKLKGLQVDHTELTTGYVTSMSGFKNAIDNLTAALDPIYFTSNRAFVEAMNPEFKADEYRKINGLGADVDVYAHFLEEGQFKGLPTNNAAVKDLATNTATSTAVDKTSPTAVSKDEIFDGTNYDSVAAAQKNAAAMGRTYFMGPDGSTYKILSDTETKDKIKGAATFGEAFTMARKTLGSGATFEWTNPETGKTSSFTTQTKEEAAARANAGSFVKVNNQVSQYVSDKILSNITDYDNFNRADLTKAEYQGFINAYLNATDAQRQQMLAGKVGYASTYEVIAGVLKDAPAAIKAQQTAQSIIATNGEIKPSDFTNYRQIVKAGFNAVATDIAGVVARGAEWAGSVLGLNTTALNDMQKLFADKRDTEMSKLVGFERPVAAGIASFIESFGSFYVGGPFTLMLATGSVTANNSWVEGANAVIDSRGNSFSSAEEARKNGVFEYRKLTDQENALRTAAMTSFEMVFEKLGVPGMNKLMQGVPLSAGADAFTAAVKRNAVGMGIEQGTEIATTIAQLTFDKMASFGLAQNASLETYTKAIADTVVATAVAVGGTTTAATALNNLRNASTALRDESHIGVTPLKFDTVVAKDSKGNNVTLAELVTATSIADFSNPTANADFANLTPVADLGSLVNIGDMNLRLGDIFSGTTTTVASTDKLSASAVAEIFRASNFIPDDNTVKGFVGQLGNTLTFTNIAKFVNQNKLDAKEVIDIAKKEGIQLTEAQAQQYVQQGDEAALSAKLAATLDPTSTTFEEAKQFFAARGYIPTDAEITKFANVAAPRPSTIDVTEANKIIAGKAPYNAKYDWDGDGKVDSTDALNLFKAAVGRTDVPTPAAASGWAAGPLRAEADVSKAIGEYINPLQVTFDEAKKYLTEKGYNPTDDEVRTFVAQVNEAEQAQKIAAYVDPRMVDAQEVRDAYAALGLKQPTEADVQKLVGQYSETELAAKAKANLDSARYNSVLAQIDLLSQKDNLTKQDVTDAITKYMADNPGLNATDVTNVINKAVKDLATSESVKSTIAEATKGFATKADIDTAIANIKFPPGISKADVAETIKAYMEANPGLSIAEVTKVVTDATADLTTSDDVKTAVELALEGYATSKDVEAVQKNVLDKMAEYEAAGSKRDEALDKAVTAVADSVGKSKEEILGQIGAPATVDASGKPIAATGVYKALEAGLADVQKNVLDKMGEYEKAGLSRDEALAKSVETVATSLGTTKEAILGQIGTPATVDANGKPVAATGVYKALEAGLADVQKNVLDKVAEYEKAGLTRDEALAKSVTDVATDLGTTKETILGQIGTPATTDANGNVVAATGVYKALETGLAGVQKNVLDKVAEYEAAGLKRDDALAKAIQDVSTNLGVAQETILGQIGAPASVDAQGKTVPATGIYATLETSTATVQKNVLDKMAEYEKAGISRDEALAKSIEDVSNQLGKTKEDIQGQIGTPQTVDQNGNVVAATGVYAAINTASQLAQQQFTNLQTDLQTKYAGLSQGQKDLTDLLTKQGIDLNTAIQAVQADTAAGFKDVLSQLGTTQADLQKQITDTAAANQARTDALARANAAQALTTQRRGGFNTLVNMLSQAQDLGGQQVTVKQADPAKIGYIYDWSSIFANPQQQKMFASPYGAYAQGGVVRDEMDDVNDELLKLLRG